MNRVRRGVRGGGIGSSTDRGKGRARVRDGGRWRGFILYYEDVVSRDRFRGVIGCVFIEVIVIDLGLG